MPPESTRWKPGQSGNPGGRPKGSFSARQYGRIRWGEDDEGTGFGKRAREIWDALDRAAFDGDMERVKALTAIIAEIEGRPTEFVEKTSVKRFRIELDPS